MLASREYVKEGILPESLFKDSIGLLNTGELSEIEIVVAGPISAFVGERRWHESQQTFRTERGVHIKMNVRINDELVRWVLSLGQTATVQSPNLLRELVQSMAEHVANKYCRKAG